MDIFSQKPVTSILMRILRIFYFPYLFCQNCIRICAADFHPKPSLKSDLHGFTWQQSMHWIGINLHFIGTKKSLTEKVHSVPILAKEVISTSCLKRTSSRSQGCRETLSRLGLETLHFIFVLLDSGLSNFGLIEVLISSPKAQNNSGKILHTAILPSQVFLSICQFAYVSNK